ncbi:tripartite motif-containing protein 43C-like [Apodemus sylvaticus]|uniref:tripartite motif-containing protein 43C-like n=1 Tax=Apodemus sylvaticus TaxID=10129 RepID=UPI0022435E27|nr:tripartite motif-containing protein 43C-like [Apodemus sylvaticus]
MRVHKRSQLIEMCQELIAMYQKSYEVLLLQDGVSAAKPDDTGAKPQLTPQLLQTFKFCNTWVIAHYQFQLQYQDDVTLRGEMIRTQYSKLHPPLNEEVNQYMACMKNQSSIILEALRENEAMMVHKRSQLIELCQELKATSQKPYEVLLLQDLDDLFSRSELVQLTQRMKPKLSAHPNIGLTARYKYFQVKVFFQNLIIYNCHRSLVFGVRRFTSRYCNGHTFLAVPRSYRASWGTESFTTGKHYWELDLKNYKEWAVGVCDNVWLKKRNFEIGSEGAFLLVCLMDGDHYSLHTTCPIFHHHIEKPTGRVGVFLDCEGGCVSFLDVTQSSLIYSYCPGTFHCTVRPYYCTVYKWS